MEEIDLEFLESLPTQNHYESATNTPNIFNDIDANFRKGQYGLKRFKLPQNIAKVDELVQEIDKLKSINVELQQQLKGFQISAQQVQELYTKEKEEHDIAKSNLEQLQKDYQKVDVDLTNISMVNGQLKARLADYDKRPVKFDNLALKYVKIMNKLEGHDILKHYPDKDLIEKLKEYCISMKLKIPRTSSPKKWKSWGSKVKNEEAAVQCNLLEENFNLKPNVQDQSTQCSTMKRDQACQYNTITTACIQQMENASKKYDCQSCKIKPKVQDQTTQCHKITRDQGSQYISTMITRQTNTDKIMQKHMQTMFPEPPAIDDILKVYSKWSTIRSVSPILSPSRICGNSSKEIIKEYSTTGTCTMLCNIRRRIDYLPLNNSSNIKQEYFTPSASPTPMSYPITESRSRLDSFSTNVPCNISSSLLNLLNSNTNSSLEHLSSKAFNELWQIFGKMLLSLLQNSNGGIANTTPNFPLNQQQFLDWLQELYTISVDQNMPNAQTQRDPSIATTPLFFNNASTLSGNVLRPQPQKTLTEENLGRTNIRESVNNISSDNTSTSNSNEMQTINISESHLHKLHITSVPEEQSKSIMKSKTKHEIFEKLQELLPTTNLNKKERKLLKRLLKNRNHRKKALKTGRTKDYNKQSPVVILRNEDYSDDIVETAVDFLKPFAVIQQHSQPLEDNISEKEKIFLKQISNENVPNDVPNIPTSEEFAFIKPSISLTHAQPSSQKLENKYQLLFGESDSECEEQEMKTEKFIFNHKPVIKSSVNLGSGNSIINLKECTKLGSDITKCDLKESNNCTVVNLGNVNFSLTDPKFADCDEPSLHQVNQIESTKSLLKNFTNTSQQKSSLFETVKPIFVNLNHFSATQNTVIADMPTAVLKNLEYNDKDSEYIRSDANAQSLNYSPEMAYSSCNNLELSDAIKKINVEQDKGTLQFPENCGDVDNPVQNHNVIVSSTDNIMPHQKIIATAPLFQRDNYMPERNIDCLPNLCGDDSSIDSMKYHEKIINSDSMYSDDLYNDFDISSDNESLIIENETSDVDKFKLRTVEDNNFCSESFNSNCSNLSRSSSSESAEISMKSIESIQQEDELYYCKENAAVFELNNLNATNVNDSKSIIEAEGERTSTTYPVKDSLKTMEESKKAHEEENMNTILNYEPKEQTCFKIYDGEDILESTFKDASCKNVTEEINTIQSSEIKHKDILFNICKANVIQSSSLIKSEDKAKFMRKLPDDSFYQTFQRFVNKKNLERSNIVSHAIPLTTSEVKKFLKKENDNIAVNVLNSSNTQLRQSNFAKIEFTNQSNSVENSASYPITVVSDSKINETSNNKNNNENVPKFSKLSTLKLLDISNIHNHQNNSYNSMKNTQSNQILKDEKNQVEIVKTTASENFTNSIKSYEYSNTSEKSRRERVVILSCSTITKSPHTNHCNNNINSSDCSEVTPNYCNDLDMVHQNYLNEQGEDASQVIKRGFDTAEFSNTELLQNIIPNLNTSCNMESSDNSWSLEDNLMIDERSSIDTLKPTKTEQHLNNFISTVDLNDTANSSNISSESAPNEDIMMPLYPTINGLVKDELGISEVKSKRGRKRKNDCLIEVQPSKRSQRLKDKQIILQDSLSLSKTAIELGKYTNSAKNPINNVHLKFHFKEETKKMENESRLHLGFFRERLIEEDITTNNTKTFNVAKHQEPDASDVKTFRISSETKDSYKQEHQECGREREKYNEDTFTIFSEPEIDHQQAHNLLEIEKQRNLQELENCKSQKVCFNTDSPQSPQPTQSNHEVPPETLVIIPLERPLHFMPQVNIPTLFDVLISSYKIENQKKFMESVSSKESRRKENILNTFMQEIKFYCYSKMELDLYCTSTSLINKLLSLSLDYNLIQKALILVAQNAEAINVPENDLPSIIQEMPPRHLSKCLQRLFVFLKNIITRNTRFCQDLITNIEAILFNYKKLESLSLQASLNLTQLYLMASKAQEDLKIPKHPARLFIAKCLYFHFQNSVPMIHEVLMWYPTVLPHREDKTYDRSDALISVLQHILMSTKYDMCKLELRGKILLSKLRYEYHFEPFKPTADEIINVLIEKLKSSKFYNIMLAFVLLCKRLGEEKTQNLVLHQHLIPLANEFYCLALKTNEYDERIAVLLEVISILIRSVLISTDVQIYFNEFARFLNGFERQIIQEAALCALLRLQRFNVERCYNSLRHFRPAYNLNTRTQAMLKSFLYQRSLNYWKNLNSHTPKILN